MKHIVRTYNLLNSTVFDLLSEDIGAKQTTALAYLLSKDKNTLQDFLNLEDIKRIFWKIKIEYFDFISNIKRNNEIL